MAKAPKVIEERDPEEVYAEFLSRRERDLEAMGEDFSAPPATQSDEFLAADFIEARNEADGEGVDDAPAGDGEGDFAPTGEA